MRWVTVVSACWTQFIAKVCGCEGRTRWCGRRGKQKGGRLTANDRATLPGAICPPRPPLPLPRGSSYLLVTHGSSWWRETLSIATKHVCPSPSLPSCNLHTRLSLDGCCSFTRETNTQHFKSISLPSKNLTQCFPTAAWRSQWLTPCKCCKTADFLDTGCVRHDGLHKH